MIKYHVDEPKRTVVAILEDCEFDAANIISRKTDSLCLIYGSNYVMKNDIIEQSKKYNLPERFVGIAKCDPRDTFDVNEGKRLAKKRCLDKYHRALHKTIDRYCIDMMNEAGRAYSALASDNLLYCCEE